MDTIENKKWTINGSKSAISFETTGGGGWKKWDRYIAIDGKKAFHIGNICGTCSFFFEKLEGVNKPNQTLTSQIISTTFQEGLTQLEDDFLSKVSLILPNGEYIVSLKDIKPKFIELGSDQDYFHNEQVQVWGIDSFYGLPHSPNINYYRGISKEISNTSMLFEFFVPTFPKNWLDEDTIKKYKSIIADDKKPTALSISVLDIKEPADFDEDITHTEHWCLTHYIIDGHHKVYSASIQNKPITLLSFLAKKECIANKGEITTLFNYL